MKKCCQFLALLFSFFYSFCCFAQQWSGTGFALGNGYIATNNHVIDGAQAIKVYGVNGNKESHYSAEVKIVDVRTTWQ